MARRREHVRADDSHSVLRRGRQGQWTVEQVVISWCSECALPDGQLTTDCPGGRCSLEGLGLALAGEADYRDGRWRKGYHPPRYFA